MIENDPFKTREEALKTILRVDDVIHYLWSLNQHTIGPCDICDYFHSLYQKWPDEFALEQPGSCRALKFMGQELIIFIEEDGHPVRNVKEFFKYWKTLK